ncbi:MAG TPA: hypothetical protein VK465_18860, partial [Fibrobacteria bacterium]|nr:hypothetical protein [Fibrobacteria bacterium]
NSIPFSLPYAETHYKFKLPWSPLSRPWPEIFLDGPSFCIPERSPTFYLVLKDADYFPVKVREIEVVLQTMDGRIRKQTLPLDLRCEENLSFLPLAIDFAGLSGDVALTGKITVENRKGRRRTILNANFPGIAPSPLRVRLLSSPLPYPEGWFAGEMHCHSDYSNDPVEFGAPLEVLQQAGASLGMGFVLCTDHSYDFYYRKTRYMERTDPDANFQAYRAKALRLNECMSEDSGLPVVIPGEEVSCGNHRGENVHLLVAGHPDFLPGLGDGGRRWLNNQPDLTIGEVLEHLGDTPRFAAHPRARIGALEKFIFRRGMWHAGDLQPGGQGATVGGLQFWNGHRGRDFREGREFWVQQLLAGHRLLPIGANDAHGDLNRNIGVKTPLFSLYQSRNHVFGHVRTVVQAERKTLAGIQEGLRRGRVLATDGPFLTLSQSEGSQGKVRLSARGTVDFGGMEKVSLFAGKRNGSGEALAGEWSMEGGSLEWSGSADIPAGCLYLRAEGRTTAKRFALTSPLFP